MNTLKHIFRSNVVMSVLAMGSLFVFKDADAQTSDRAKEFSTNADGVRVDDKDPAVAKLTVVDVTGVNGSEIRKDARNMSRSGKVLAIVMNIGGQAQYTPEQIIDALDNRVFTGENEIALHIYKEIISGSYITALSVYSNGVRLFENSQEINGEPSGFYNYLQIKNDPAFFINGKGSFSVVKTASPAND